MVGGGLEWLLCKLTKLPSSTSPSRIDTPVSPVAPSSSTFVLEPMVTEVGGWKAYLFDMKSQAGRYILTARPCHVRPTSRTKADLKRVGDDIY